MRILRDMFAAQNGQLAGWDFGANTYDVDNVHVDLRSFYNYDISRRRIQSEIDTLTQQQLDTMSQAAIESEIAVRGEFWSVTGAGFHNSPDWLDPQTWASTTAALAPTAWWRFDDLASPPTSNEYDAAILARADTVAYWKQGEASGDLLDSAGGGYTLTMSGNPTYGQASMLIAAGGSSINYDGTGDYATRAWQSELNPASVTFETWVKPASLASQVRIAASCDASVLRGWHFYINPNGSLGVTLGDGAATSGVSSAIGLIVANRTYHVAFTYDSGNVGLYIDGVRVANASDTMTPATSGLFCIGRASDFAGLSMNGLMERSGFHNAALTATEIRDLFVKGRPVSDAMGNHPFAQIGNGLTSADGAVTGDSNAAIHFDGASYLLRPFDPDLNAATFSITGKIRREVDTGTTEVVCESKNGNTGYSIYVTAGGKLSFPLWDGAGGTDLVGATSIATGQWYDFAVTFDGSTRKLYIDGVLESSGADALSVNTSGPLTIGATRTGTLPWQGDLDELTYHSGVVLTDDEIRERYAYGAAKLADVGVIEDLDNWRGLTLITTDEAIDCDIISSIPADSSIPAPSAINISEEVVGAGAFLSLVMMGDLDRADFDATNSYIQLSSAEDGDFDTASYCTAEIAFDQNTSIDDGMLVIPMADVLTSPGADFDETKVRGVKVHLEKVAGAAGSTLHLLAMRVLGADWDWNIADIETRRGILAPSVHPTLTSADPWSAIRGAGDSEDFTLTDGSVEVFFSAGGAAARATGSDMNEITLVTRQSAADDMATAVTFGWNDSGCEVTTARLDSGVAVNEVTKTSSVVLDPAVDERIEDGVGYGVDGDAGRYCMRVSLTGNNISVAILPSDGRNSILGNPVALFDVTDTSLLAMQGRVGLEQKFVDLDAFVDEIRSGNYGLATLRTLPMSSYTPVDGARLIASSSQPENLFTKWSWLTPSEESYDYSNTPSGLGSAMSLSGVMSNPMFITDWTKTSIRCKVWVAERGSDPHMVMQCLAPDENGDPISATIPLPRLRANQWNDVFVDLSRFANQYTGVWYVLSIMGGGTEFAVDSMHVDRIVVDWSIRADESHPWRSFGPLVNDDRGAVHLGRERGRSLQLQATALTPDAWVSHLRLQPRYAQLGLPLYDESYQRT